MERPKRATARILDGDVEAEDRVALRVERIDRRRRWIDGKRLGE